MKQRDEAGGKPSVVLLGVTYATNNLGVNALTDSAIAGILRHSPNADISILDYAKRESRFEHDLSGGHRISIPVIPMRFSKNLSLKNNIAVLLLIAAIGRLIPAGRRRALYDRYPVLRGLAHCDVAAAASGGDSFSDIYGLFRFFYVSLPQLLVALTGKSLILLPQTVGPFRTNIARWTARAVLVSAKRIYARDYISLRRARDLLGIPALRSKVQFRPDMAFTLPVSDDGTNMKSFIAECTRFETEKPVAVNVSGLLYMGGYSRANMFGLRVDYRRLVKEMVHRLAELHSGSIVLLPHVFGINNPESDEAVCLSLYEEFRNGPLGDRVLVPGFQYNQREVKSLIANCELVVASRMHVCIAALSLGIPAVGVAYSRKFQGVMESLNLDGLIADPRSLDEVGVLNRIEKTYVERDSYRDLLSQRISGIRKKADGLFADIDGFFSGMTNYGREDDVERIVLKEETDVNASDIDSGVEMVGGSLIDNARHPRKTLSHERD